MKGPYANALLALFSGVVASVLVYLFYVSELRGRVENKLFDIRTRLAPSLTSTDQVALITINQDSIDRLQVPPKAASDEKSDKLKDLGYPALIQIVEAALKTKARTVAVLIPPQIFSYQDPGMKRLVAMGLGDGRLMLGVFDQTIKGQTRAVLPEALQGAEAFAFKADFTRDFRRDIIRTLTVDETGELPYLAGQVLEHEDHQAFQLLKAGAVSGKATVELNYVSPTNIRQIPAADLLADQTRGKELEGKVVLIGYTAFRPWTFVNREATYVNTPWQAEGGDVNEGLPVVTVTAIGLINLLESSWLRPATLMVNVAQTLLVAVVMLATWQLTIGFASFLFIGGWSIILLAHSLVFSALHVHVPLTDAFLWSSLATIIGALSRLRIEGRLRAEQEARFTAEKELARIQDRFLSRFATELASINGRIHGILTGLAPLAPATGTGHTAYVRALGSSEELNEYLAGIGQFASLREAELASPALAQVEVLPVIEGVIRQFDSRKLETRISFDVKAEGVGFALADRTLLAQILYNLVSNAVKYSPPDATVHIKVEGLGTGVTVRVKDRGPGIASEFHDQIFEKFYRVKDDFVYKHKGHGLGLYLSRFFAAQIGATIAVDSRLGDGAEFSLNLKRGRT